MKRLPLNLFAVAAAVWFAAGIYALIFREAGNAPPPFPNFDKVAHFALFFGQIWLAAKAYIKHAVRVPYLGLAVFALLFALGSEWAQAAFTLTRQASWGDVLADMAGAAAALWFARQVAAAKAAVGK